MQPVVPSPDRIFNTDLTICLHMLGEGLGGRRGGGGEAGEGDGGGGSEKGGGEKRLTSLLCNFSSE